MGRKRTGKKNFNKKALAKKASCKRSGKAATPKSAQGENNVATNQLLDKGRVVVTHSTYIPGLIPLLEKLATIPRIQTITPAVISRARSNAPTLQLKVSVATMGGHKLIARKGKSAQEVFVVTELSKGDLEDAIASLLP